MTREECQPGKDTKNWIVDLTDCSIPTEVEEILNMGPEIFCWFNFYTL